MTYDSGVANSSRFAVEPSSRSAHPPVLVAGRTSRDPDHGLHSRIRERWLPVLMTISASARDNRSRMVQSLIVGLLLAAVSATSLVAFRHPHGYARLFPFLVLGASVLFVGVVIWHVAVETMWAELSAFFDAQLRQQATAAKDELSPPFVWIAISYLAVIAFLWINLKLPPFLSRADDSAAAQDDGS